MFEVNISKVDNVTVLVVGGRVDSNTADQLGEALTSELEKGSVNLVADLEAVDYMSSAGLRELVAALKQVKQKNGDLHLASPTERVQEVLELSGLDSIFAVHQTRQDAIDSF